MLTKILVVGGAAVAASAFEVSRRSTLILTAASPLGRRREKCIDDSCIFEETREVVVGDRRLRLRQEFGGGGGTTGLGVWECSRVLSDYLSGDGVDVVRGKRVVEVGCGCGLCSMTASLLGASQVVATDGDTAVLGLARKNLDENGFGRVNTRQLRWEEAKFGDFDADVVLGADVTYFPGSALPLANALLASGCQEAYIAHRRRTPKDDQTIATLEQTFGPSAFLDRVDGIDVYRFDRKVGAPKDLSDEFERVQCNPGYSVLPGTSLCVPTTR